MWRNRSVGSRVAPTASTTSWPWAQASISRAVRNDFDPIEGPYHAIRVSFSSVAAAAASSSRPDRQAARSSSGDIARYGPSVMSSAEVPSSPPEPSRACMASWNASGSVIASAALRSK